MKSSSNFIYIKNIIKLLKTIHIGYHTHNFIFYSFFIATFSLAIYFTIYLSILLILIELIFQSPFFILNEVFPLFFLNPIIVTFPTYETQFVIKSQFTFIQLI